MSSFIARNKPDWEELEQLIRRGQKSIKRLTPNERERLDILYRRTTVHLSRASTLTRDQQLISYLNGLTAAAHSLIYLPPRGRTLSGALRFVTEGFARAIARQWRAHAISAALVIGGAILGYIAAASDPLLAHAMWPRSDVRQPGSSPDQLLSVLRSGRDDGGASKAMFASFLFQHNLKVGLLALATGILACVPTVFLMLMNGMLLGVFVAIHYEAGIQAEMWAWILPHGITEIGAIILCGGVGLVLGQAIIQPGLNSRKQALLNAGRESAKVCIGVTMMLIFAAVIESFLRQSHLSTTARLAFAAATAIFWAAYIYHGFNRERIARLRDSKSSDNQHGELAAA